ncbi:MAG: hypothetical protein ACRC1K_21315 [Planctomycetia bacterium]
MLLWASLRPPAVDAAGRLVDPDGYLAFAVQLVETGVYADPSTGVASAHRPPLYPLLLAPGVFVSEQPWAWVWLVNNGAVLGTAILAARLARVWGAERFSVAAAVLVLFDPLLYKQSREVMTEPLSALLSTALVYAWSMKPKEPGAGLWRWRATTALLLALGTLARPTAWAVWLVWLAGLAIAALVRRSPRRVSREAVVVGLLALVVAAPWAVRNQFVFQRFTYTTSHGGYTLWLGMNEDFYAKVAATGDRAAFASWTPPVPPAIAELTTTDEWTRDAAYQRLAVDWMKNNPGAAAWSVIFHVAAFWSPAPAGGGAAVRWACFGYYGVLYAAVLTTLWQWTRAYRTVGPKPGVGLAAAVVLAFTLVHAVYWSNPRMRAPVMPILAAAAATAAPILNSMRATGKSLIPTLGRNSEM